MELNIKINFDNGIEMENGLNKVFTEKEIRDKLIEFINKYYEGNINCQGRQHASPSEFVAYLFTPKK